jgi:hypothetical protein
MIPMLTRLLLFIFLTAGSAFAQTGIRSAGVLANSGYAGDTLVRFGPGLRADSLGLPATARNQLRGLGVDSSGFLWAFAGPSQINRYSADGRLISSHPLTQGKKNSTFQILTVAGDTLYLVRDEKLWSRPTAAPPSEDFLPLGIAARSISLNAIDGKVGLVAPDGGIAILDLATKQSTPRGSLPKGAGQSITLLPDGSLVLDSKVLLPPTGPDRAINLSGTPSQWVNGALYSYRWHNTIERYNADAKPDPGVVLGGSSGSFIGSLPLDGEMNLPTGLAHLGDQRYAVVSSLGVIHLLEWNAAGKKFQVTRRIGAAHRASGLALDRLGRVWWNTGYWNWADNPAQPPHNTMHMTQNDGWQVAMLDSDAMCALTIERRQRDEPLLLSNTFDASRNRRTRLEGLTAILPASLTANLTGATSLGKSGEVLFTDAAGQAALLDIRPDGQFKKVIGPATLKLTSAKPSLTSLGLTPAGDLLAADGNAIVRFQRKGNTFTEVERLQNWGATPDQSFGDGLFLAADGPHLWVSDPTHNRVLLIALTPAGFGQPVLFSGDDSIGSLDRPGRIAARGTRAVVFDQGNQRLVKLEAAGP